MARFNFKDNPVLNDETFIGSSKFRWNGSAWIREQFDLNALLSQLKEESVTEAVQSSTQSLVNAAPEALDTIQELAAALGNDHDFATTMTNTLATKADSNTVNASLATKADTDTVNASLSNKVDKTKTIDEITANYTVVLDDAATILNCNNTSGITITIPLNATVALPVGTEIAFIRKNTGEVTIAGAVGVTISSADSKFKIKGQYGTAAVLKVAENEWILAGSLEA
jgi:hypothetical protein